ncbi:MBL fold metallo-hydrolase [Maribacter aestuarii]|uniref:MBL fold metallo-hydrolase n=1 Tax=Maribacter aestuarii TaxID=1130723 RepID=UPI00248BB5BA|nr:MBL fold metallo-hydrolase [Maribacter aestuarii]
MITQSPLSTEVEVTLIGTGGGYGESVVLKLGIDKWIVIDSCVNPETKEPLALEYLIGIGADLSKVVLIVCTHWHSNHIAGLSKLLEKCPNCEFSFSSVNDLNKFLLLCELDYSKSLKGSKSSTKEFAKCLEIINDRGTYFTKAQSDLLLMKIEENLCNFELFALSPSPKTVINFDGEISKLITQFGTRNTAIINKSPNDKSVALLLKFNDVRVLLGADLEIGKDNHEGWRHIVYKSKAKDKTKSKLYKIPHHGSHNGYLKEIFEVLVDEHPTLKLTPFRSSNLPREDMIEKYSNHSKEIYSTSAFLVSKKPKKRDKSIEKIIERNTLAISEIKFNYGVVRSRINYEIKHDTWKTEVFESGLKVKINQED